MIAMPVFSDILAWSLVAMAALVPIVGWGYLFSYAGGDALSARRFVGGLLAGAVSAAVIFALDRAFTGGLAPFHPYTAPTAGAAFPWQFLLGAAGSGLALLALASLAAAGLARDPLPGLALAAKAAPSVVLFAVALTLLRLGLEASPAWNLSTAVSARGVQYASLTLAFAYYLAVAAVEEISKLGHAAPSFPGARNAKDAVLTALFVALGFAFFENVLYVKSQWDAAGSGAIATLAFRSLFSTFLHAGATAVAASWLVRDLRFSKVVPNAAVGLLLAAFLHGAFNAGTAAGWGWVPFAYLAGGYLIGGKAFFQEDPTSDDTPLPEDPALPEPA